MWISTLVRKKKKEVKLYIKAYSSHLWHGNNGHSLMLISSLLSFRCRPLCNVLFLSHPDGYLPESNKSCRLGMNGAPYCDMISTQYLEHLSLIQRVLNCCLVPVPFLVYSYFINQSSESTNLWLKQTNNCTNRLTQAPSTGNKSIHLMWDFHRSFF